MKTKHIPQPWRVFHEGTSEVQDSFRHDFAIITPIGEHDNEIGRNTEKLIEAAPELFNLCDKLKFALAGYMAESETAMSCDYDLLEQADKLLNTITSKSRRISPNKTEL